jgi:hypothetical protein
MNKWSIIYLWRILITTRRNSELIADLLLSVYFQLKQIHLNIPMATKVKSNSEKLDNSGVTGLHGDTTLVGSAFDESVAGLSPSGAPLVADDPVRCGAVNTVTDDGHFVVQTVVVGQAGGIAEHARPGLNREVFDEVN